MSQREVLLPCRIKMSHGAWQFVPVIPALKEDYKFEASLGYTRACLLREREDACVFSYLLSKDKVFLPA